MRFLGNVLWVILGGIEMALVWFSAGVVCMLTVVGIPLGIQCMKIAGLVLWPFGKKVTYGGQFVQQLGNILWILLAGWMLASVAGLLGIVYCATIVGIPFGLQWFKFCKLALMPFGAKVE